MDPESQIAIRCASDALSDDMLCRGCEKCHLPITYPDMLYVIVVVAAAVAWH